MAQPHYIIAASEAYAKSLARMVEAGDISALYLSRQEADRALANYPNGFGVTYRVYEVPRQTKAKDAAATATLFLLAIGLWLILPGEAHAAFEQRHAPVSATDYASIWIAGGIFISAAVLGLGAFIANAFRDKPSDFYGENYDGRD